MIDLIAFYESRAGTTTLQEIAGLADPHVNVSGDNINVPPMNPYILALVCLAQTATSGGINKAQVKAPSLGARSYIDIDNFVDTATGIPEPTSPQPILDFRYNQIPLTPGENLQFLTANSGTNTEDALGLVWLSDGNITPINGAIETVKFTNGSTLVANAWTNGALTASQQLRAGNYAVVGMAAKSAGLQAARLVFGNQGARPGCIGQDAYSDVQAPANYFRHGNLGTWGTFPHTAIPTVDFLSDSADTSQEVWLDLVYLGA